MTLTMRCGWLLVKSRCLNFRSLIPKIFFEKTLVTSMHIANLNKIFKDFPSIHYSFHLIKSEVFFSWIEIQSRWIKKCQTIFITGKFRVFALTIWTFHLKVFLSTNHGQGSLSIYLIQLELCFKRARNSNHLRKVSKISSTKNSLTCSVNFTLPMFTSELHLCYTQTDAL